MSLQVNFGGGQKHSFKVTPATTLASVLQQACALVKYDAQKYALALSGLSNSATVDVVRSKSQGGLVNVAVQIPNGERLQNQFSASTTLQEILDSWVLSGKLDLTNMDPVIIFMNKQINSDALLRTTLQSLGLVSGSALLRLTLNPQKLTPPQTSSPQQASIPHQAATPQQIPPTSTSPSVNPQNSASSSHPSTPQSISPVIQHQNTDDDIPSNSLGADRKEKGKVPTDIPDIPADRDLKVFGPTSASFDPAQFDVPEGFYEVTTEDVHTLISQEKKRKEADQYLRTRAMREKEKRKRTAHIIKTLIRVRFPDRVEIQGVFKVREPISQLYEFVKGVLATPEQPFILYITPPVTHLTDGTFQSLSLAPSAIVLFSWKDRKVEFQTTMFRRAEYLNSLSSPCIKPELLEGVEYKPVNNATPTSNTPPGRQNPSPMSIDTEPPIPQDERRPRDEPRPSTQPGNTSAPKWFAKGKKF